MLKKTCGVILILTLLMITYSCNTALKVGDSVVGIQSGKFFYTDGTLRTNYHASYDQVWNACRKTIREMKASDIKEEKKIADGEITATLYEEAVRITVTYVKKEITQVGIRVGVAGNNFSSQIIHDKIKTNLLNQQEATSKKEQ